EHLARLRVEDDDRAVPVAQLRDGLLLQFAVNRQAHVEVRGQLDVAPQNEVERFGRGGALYAEERALKAGVAAVGAEQLRHLRVERVIADDLSVGRASVERERAVELARAV